MRKEMLPRKAVRETSHLTRITYGGPPAERISEQINKNYLYIKLNTV